MAAAMSDGPAGNGQHPVGDGEVAPEPDEAASAAARAAAERFFRALAEGDNRTLWELFSEDARAYVINIALERGMDMDFASRLRDGTAGDVEFDDYTQDLLTGIRADVGNIATDNLQFEASVDPASPDRLVVRYLVQMSESIGGVYTAIPAGSLLMTEDSGQWKVQRLIPKPG